MKRIMYSTVVPTNEDFPGYFAGASLKLSTLLSFLFSPARRLPRLLRRGLIEAPRRTVRILFNLADFPGYFAGASLKP